LGLGGTSRFYVHININVESAVWGDKRYQRLLLPTMQAAKAYLSAERSSEDRSGLPS
jgi:hypothetical protein